MKKELSANLAFAAVMLALALGAAVARRLGYMDGELVTRLVTGSIGLWIVWSGNRMPKTMVPVPTCAGQGRRVASWSMVLSGLAYVGLWAFAPIPVAVWAGTSAVLAGIAVTFGYCLSLPAKAKAS